MVIKSKKQLNLKYRARSLAVVENVMLRGAPFVESVAACFRLTARGRW